MSNLNYFIDNMNEQVISKHDLEEFNNGSPDNKVQQIWQNIVTLFPEELQVEANEKRFTLKRIDESMGLINFIIEVNNPSEKLQKELVKHNLFIICIND